MKYIDYKEQKQHGTVHFPIEYFCENPHTPRYLMQYHWHPECEIIHIISGTFQIMVNNHPVLCRKDDVIFLSEGFLHGGTPHDCVYEGVVFDLAFFLQDSHACAGTIRDILDHRYLIRTRLSDSSTAVLPVTEELFASMASHRTGYEFITQGCLYRLLGIILGEHLYDETDEKLASAKHLEPVKNALSYIASHYSENVTLNHLADAAGMNPKYFCRYFRGMTSRTPIDYLNYYRIECACEMLATKNITVKEAAFSCGFHDESYFIRIFQKYKGVTPRQYMTAVF